MCLRASSHNQPSCHEDNENLYLALDFARGLLLRHQGDNGQLQERGEGGVLGFAALCTVIVNEHITDFMLTSYNSAELLSLMFIFNLWDINGIVSIR